MDFETIFELEQPYPQAERERVELDKFDNEIRDGDSNAIFSFEIDDTVGEVFYAGGQGGQYYEIYPHDGAEPLVFFKEGSMKTSESDFICDAVLKTVELRKAAA